MSGTTQGGKRAAKTNKEKHGKDFYRQIGHMGGVASYHGKKGFAAMSPEQRSRAGKIGGTRSRRNGPPVPLIEPLEETRYIKTGLWASIKERIKIHG